MLIHVVPAPQVCAILPYTTLFRSTKVPLVLVPDAVVTVMGPLVAPLGTGTTICPLFQLVGVATVPLNLTVLVPCAAARFVPMLVTDVLTVPEIGVMLLIVGAAIVN